jgi:hypothetical protein
MSDHSPTRVPPSAAWVADLHAIFPEYQRELLRVCPELANADGVGGATDVLPSDVLVLLRRLPDGAGTERVSQAVDAFRVQGHRDRDRDV